MLPIPLRPPRRSNTARPQDGQATVEFALLLPGIVIVVLVLFQSMIVGHDYLLVTNATREAARAASVDPSNVDAINAVQRSLPGAQLTIFRTGGIGSQLTATVRWHARTSLPLVGPMLPDPWLESSVTMRVER